MFFGFKYAKIRSGAYSETSSLLGSRVATYMQLELIIRVCCVSPSFPMHLFGVVLKIKDGFTFYTLRAFPYICVCMPICIYACVCVCAHAHVYKCNKKLGVPYFSSQFTMFVDYWFF